MRMLFATFLAAMVAQGADFNVRAFGAKCDGASKDTAAIQRAVDAANTAGGGRVVLDAGTYLSGTIWLKDGVELHLAKGAVVKGSPDRADYNANDCFPENFWSDGEEWSGGHLVLAYKAKDVAITGEGVIDGNGPAFFGECEEDSRFPWYKYGLKLHPKDRSWFRPGPMVAMFLSKNIRLSGVTLANTPAWTAHFRCCDGLDIRNVTIDADRTIANSDGFSIDCTRNVVVDGCTIKTGDDGFAIRASCKQTGHAEQHPCESIRIVNCDVWSCCYGIRFGIGIGTVRDVAVENCRFHESANGIGFNPAWIPGKKGVYIENIRISRCAFQECARPVDSNARSDDWRIRDITFEDCRFESLQPIAFSSPASRHPENVTFRNCTRKYLDVLRVRHHRGWGGKRSKKFIEGGPVTNLRVENCLPSDERKGVLVLSFDDRNFNDWVKAMPLFEKYGAHATFFVCGPIDGEAVRVMKRLSEAGHSVGLHGLRGGDRAAAGGVPGRVHPHQVVRLPELPPLGRDGRSLQTEGLCAHTRRTQGRGPLRPQRREAGGPEADPHGRSRVLPVVGIPGAFPSRHGDRGRGVPHGHRGHPEVHPPLCGAQGGVRAHLARHLAECEGDQHEDRMAGTHSRDRQGMRRRRPRLRRAVEDGAQLKP